MDKLVVASAQQQMRLFDSADDYRKELSRFLHMAHAKGAGLVVFPALSGILAATPMAAGFRMNLLRQAMNGRSRASSLWERARSAFAGSTAGLLKASFRKVLSQLLQAEPQKVANIYTTVFGELAATYQVTIVGGSAYLPGDDGVVRHSSLVFGPDGAILGRHDKALLSATDAGLAAPGEALPTIATPVGRLGLLIGEEAQYPELGRALAYGGAELLVVLAANGGEVAAAYTRQAAIARAQENQCFGIASFLVGHNHLPASDRDGAALFGRSGIYAPLEMTPRHTGVLVEMGTAASEGLLTAELDRDQLRSLWQSGISPVRRQMPFGVLGHYLPEICDRSRTLADVWSEIEAPPPVTPPALPAPEEPALAEETDT